jgi:benzoate transport
MKIDSGGNGSVNSDPRQLISSAPMSRMQIIAVGMTFVLNALDGFDVLSISFASPGIAAEWGINRAALGIVLSMELIGMALGSVLLGGVADRFGRRKTMLGCLVAMAGGMFMATTVAGLVDLSVWRVITGMGIGGMLATINATAAEFSNERRKYLCVSLMAIGYPVGVVFGGTIAAQLLVTHDWRSVFYLGATMTAVCIPLVYYLIPESVHWLAYKQPEGALERINHTLKRMRHGAISALPAMPSQPAGRRVSDIFAPALLATTVIVTLAYFLHVMTFYFIIKWVPKLVVDMGFMASSAASVLVWANVGGATGGAVLGLLTLRYNVKGLTVAVLALSTVMIVIFGRTPPDLTKLSLICAAAGFCTNAGIVGLYAIFAHAYPTHVRASGTGFAVGMGRGGSVLAPIIAGFLFEAGVTLPTVSILMGLGSTLAAGILLLLKLSPDQPGTPQPAPASSAQVL